MNLVERDARHIVETYRRLPVDIVRTEGSYVYDASGKRYLDLVCGLAVHPLGHRHPAVLDAISRQLDRYLHVSNLFVQQPQLELAERLARMSGYPRVFFCNSGAGVRAATGMILSVSAARSTAGQWAPSR
jgi:acetylornithine/N-succinyldiaminopimelate aminotransferase